jgi:hypothetical protein
MGSVGGESTPTQRRDERQQLPLATQAELRTLAGASRGPNPSASVQRRGSFIAEPPASRTTTVALPADKTSSSRPCNGWCRRMMVTLASISET